MRHYLYSIDSGVFTGMYVEAPDSYTPTAPPSGFAFYRGSADPARQRYDTALATLVPYTPPAETDADKTARENRVIASQVQSIQQDQIGLLLDVVAALATPGGKPATADIAKLAAARQKVADLRAKKPKP